MPVTTPPDRRPYRAAHEAGDELGITADGIARVFRQIGWHGQSGAFYALGEDPSKHEPGSFSPLWILAHSDRIPDDDEPERHLAMPALTNAPASTYRPRWRWPAVFLYRAADPGWGVMLNRYPEAVIGIGAKFGRWAVTVNWKRIGPHRRRAS